MITPTGVPTAPTDHKNDDKHDDEGNDNRIGHASKLLDFQKYFPQGF